MSSRNQFLVQQWTFWVSLVSVNFFYKHIRSHILIFTIPSTHLKQQTNSPTIPIINISTSPVQQKQGESQDHVTNSRHVMSSWNDGAGNGRGREHAVRLARDLQLDVASCVLRLECKYYSKSLSIIWSFQYKIMIETISRSGNPRIRELTSLIPCTIKTSC